MRQPHYVTETQIVRRVARDQNTRWIWGVHAPKEMSEMDPPATQADVEHVLATGTVILEEYKQDILWRVRGRDLDGRSIQVVAAVDEGERTIKIITVF